MRDTNQGLWIDPRCTTLSSERFGPFIKLADGKILTIEDNATVISADKGATWSAPRPIYDGQGPGKPSSSGVMVRTHEGVIVFVYMDMEGFKWVWDDDLHQAAEDVNLNVWAIRSEDEGLTWTGRQQIFEGYCGALIHIIQPPPVRSLCRFSDCYEILTGTASVSTFPLIAGRLGVQQYHRSRWAWAPQMVQWSQRWLNFLMGDCGC